MRFRTGPRAPSVARTMRPRRHPDRCNLLLGGISRMPLMFLGEMAKILFLASSKNGLTSPIEGNDFLSIGLDSVRPKFCSELRHDNFTGRDPQRLEALLEQSREFLREPQFQGTSFSVCRRFLQEIELDNS